MKTSPITTLLLLLFILCCNAAHSQSPCAVPPNCIVNNELEAQAGANMNLSPAHTVNGWHVSHGTPSLFGTDCPTSTNNCSIWMWSYTGGGEGVFTCFNFQAGVSYELCLWVRNTNPVIGNGHLQIWMVNNYTPYQNGNSLPPQTIVGQLIDSSHTNSTTWVQLTFTITPTVNYNTLLIYPYMSMPPINNQQYELQIDDVRLSPVGLSGNYTMSSTQNTVDWCSSTQLCINGLTQGVNINWQPSTGLDNTSGACVQASPCTSTTYTASLSVPSCPISCSAQPAVVTLSATINVEVPAVQIQNIPPATCGNPVLLHGNIEASNCAVTGQWVSPNGQVFAGDSLLLTSLTIAQTGSYHYQLVSLENACILTGGSIAVDAISVEEPVYIPNTITPNSDNQNDFFTAYGTGFAFFNLKIFDRWGMLIYETSDPATGWNGTHSGNVAQLGTYAYVVEYQTDCSLNRRKKTGHVNIIR